MFHCSGCWENPCVCGEGYKDYTQEQKDALIKAITGDEKISDLEKIKSLFNAIGIEFQEEESFPWITIKFKSCCCLWFSKYGEYMKDM